MPPSRYVANTHGPGCPPIVNATGMTRRSARGRMSYPIRSTPGSAPATQVGVVDGLEPVERDGPCSRRSAAPTTKRPRRLRGRCFWRGLASGGLLSSVDLCGQADANPSSSVQTRVINRDGSGHETSGSDSGWLGNQPLQCYWNTKSVTAIVPSVQPLNWLSQKEIGAIQDRCHHSHSFLCTFPLSAAARRIVSERAGRIPAMRATIRGRGTVR